MLPTIKPHLAETLFRPVTPPTLPPAPEMGAAVANARRRWPALAPLVEAAALMVTGGCLQAVAGDSSTLAFCWRAEAGGGMQAGRRHLVSLTATGLGCTCDEWPPQQPAGPVDGLYCPDILALLLHVYLDRPLAALPYSPEKLWAETLRLLELQLTRGTFNRWLAGTRTVPDASSARRLTVAVRSPSAQAWLAGRLAPVIGRALAEVAGYRPAVCFVVDFPLESGRD